MTRIFRLNLKVNGESLSVFSKQGKMREEMIHLFWTGGFDSTYRLIELLHKEQRPVQTYYIIDSGRPSTITELRAMEAIKESLFERSPSVTTLLPPLQLELKTNIQPNPQITNWYEGIAARTRIGIQYDWLARFAVENGLDDIELCLTRLGGEQMTGLHGMLHPELTGEGHECCLRDTLADEDMNLFRPFRFPTIHISKAEMESNAGAAGYNDLLALTWYCHTPTHEGKPCGQCRPCQVRSGSSLEHSVAELSKARKAYHRVKQTVKKLVIRT